VSTTPEKGGKPNDRPGRPQALPRPSRLRRRARRWSSPGGHLLCARAGIWRWSRPRDCLCPDTDNERAGGTTAALLLAGFGCPAI